MMGPIDTPSVRRHFGRAARGYTAAAKLQRDVATRLAESLDYAKRPPARILDLGSGPGVDSAMLRKRFPKAQVIALDAAIPMLVEARRKMGLFGLTGRFDRVAGDARALPLADASVDLVWSNLCLQWCPELDPVYDEIRRVLAPEGLFLFTTFGPRTLEELRAAWAAVDPTPRVGSFPDMPVVGDALTRAGFRDPVLDIDTVIERHADPRAVLTNLKAIGATHADAGRTRGLTGPRLLARMLDAYRAQAAADGSVGATWEVISAFAFAPDPSQPRRTRSGAIAAIPVDQLRGSRVRR
jgi:malonyl-CoA O-methyltransferase